MIKIVVDGPPVAKARPRFSSIRGPRGESIVKTYDVQGDQVAAFKASVLAQSFKKMLVGPIVMTGIFIMPIPKRMPKYKREIIERGLYPHLKKPDLSNLLKFAEDAVEGIVYKNDSQIAVYGRGTGKRYGQRPRSILMFWEFEEYFNLNLGVDKW
jgi:Holliday junction resolvase RusA-like endonuclease